MATNDFNPADLDELAAILVGPPEAPTGLRSASTDPAKVNAPGVWIRFDGLGQESLGGLTVRTTLHLVVGDADVPRALAALAPLWNTLNQVLEPLGGPAGDARRVGLVLPGSPKPLPCLAVPFDLLTTNEG